MQRQLEERSCKHLLRSNSDEATPPENPGCLSSWAERRMRGRGCADFSRKLVDRLLVAVHAVGQLPDAQVGYYASRKKVRKKIISYVTPVTLPVCATLAALAAPLRPIIVSTRLVDLTRRPSSLRGPRWWGLAPLAWGQATLPVKAGGLGLRPAVCAADSASVGSHNCTFERCRALWGVIIFGMGTSQLPTFMELWIGAVGNCGEEAY